MDIVTITRDMEQHKLHIMRVRSMQPTLDTSTPKSLGLKHLASRPKKQQLIDDRQQSIAKENQKLMERMTKIMTSTRPQPKHVKGASLSFSRREVDRVNFENSLLLNRLKTVPPVLDRNQMELDFARHCKIGAHLRRRQIKPLSHSPEGEGGDDSDNGHGHGRSGSASKGRAGLKLGGSFDAASYISQQGSISGMNGNGFGGDSSMMSMGGGGGEDSPIKSMSEFRKHVLGSKRNNNNTFIPQVGGGSIFSDNNRGDSKYEFSHNA